MDPDFTWTASRLFASVAGAAVFSLVTMDREPGFRRWFTNVSIGSLCGVFLAPWGCEYFGWTGIHAHHGTSFMTGFFGRGGARAFLSGVEKYGGDLVQKWMQKLFGPVNKE